jgi:ATP-dependent Clp protease ATP-binding subunit ClpX
MLDIMFDLPSQQDITEVVINEEVITNGEEPLFVYHKRKQAS